MIPLVVSLASAIDIRSVTQMLRWQTVHFSVASCFCSDLRVRFNHLVDLSSFKSRWLVENKYRRELVNKNMKNKFKKFGISRGTRIYQWIVNLQLSGINCEKMDYFHKLTFRKINRNAEAEWESNSNWNELSVFPIGFWNAQQQNTSRHGLEVAWKWTMTVDDGFGAANTA